MKTIIKKSMLLAVACSFVLVTTACNESDVVKGVVIGGIIGGIIGGGDVIVDTNPAYNYLSDCEGYNREWICEWSYSRHGWYRSQRRWYPQYAESFGFESVQVDLKAQEIAKRWSLGESAASKLSQAIESAKGGDLKAFDKIGLGLTTLDHLLKTDQIDINDLAKFAAKLNTTEKTAVDILDAFTKEYAQQKQDASSALWRQCQSAGQWKTPEAASCSSLDSTGCSPTTGASNCLPL